MATVTGCQSDEWIEKNPKEIIGILVKKKKRIEKEKRNKINIGENDYDYKE